MGSNVDLSLMGNLFLLLTYLIFYKFHTFNTNYIPLLKDLPLVDVWVHSAMAYLAKAIKIYK